MGFFKRMAELKKYDQSISDKQNEVERLANELSQLHNAIESNKSVIADLNSQAEAAKERRDAELAQTKSEQETIIQNYRDDREKAKAEYEENKLQLDEVTAEANKASFELERIQERIKLYRKMQNAAKKELSTALTTGDSAICDEDPLLPAVELHLHTHDSKELRKMASDVDKIIDETLKRYEGRYTTKSNIAIYQLMILALRAELQNILYTVSYATFHKCEENLAKIIERYVGIAITGNQTIASTLKSFISEIDILFHRRIEIEYEYYVKREAEKAEQQALREQMRQEIEERKVLEAERKKLENEEKKYQVEIANAKALMQNCEDMTLVAQLKGKIEKLLQQIEELQGKKDTIVQLQNGKAGYVYIISNLGSFGENTFKIGMTRRSEPMDRINELGDASVPFKFDVHSFIFSQDAVSLESALHKRLNSKRKNKVNYRKEFFDVSIDELETLVTEIDPAASFNRTMAALEYRRSMDIE